MQQRRAKWQANAGPLFEFFSSLGVLVELTRVTWKRAAARLPRYYHTPPKDPEPDTSRPPTGTLASLGYAWLPHTGGQPPLVATGGDRPETAAPTEPRLSAPSTPAKAPIIAPPTAASTWLMRAGWCDACGVLTVSYVHSFSKSKRQQRQQQTTIKASLMAWAIEPVVSSRLVTNKAVREAVLADAAQCTGLIQLQQSFAVPTQVVSTLAHARWVAVPGRYVVSHKCDGMRCLLIVDAQGRPFLLTRSGAVYEYPMVLGTQGLATSTGATVAISTSSTDAGTSITGMPLHGSTSALGSFAAAEAGPESNCEGQAVAEPAAPAQQQTSLPPATVLDGELMWLGCRDHQHATPDEEAQLPSGVFVAFDALCVGQQRVWGLPLADRLSAMVDGLGLVPADRCQELMVRRGHSATTDVVRPGTTDNNPVSTIGLSSACSTSAVVTAVTAHSSTSNRNLGGSSSNVTAAASSQPTPPACAATRKQQAPRPGQDSVLLVYKQHLDVSAESLRQLEAGRASCPYPTDGLVFTPTATPYVLGTQQLLMKWQPPAQTAADIRGADLQEELAMIGIFREGSNATLVQSLPKDLVYECVAAQPPVSPTTITAAIEAAAAAGISISRAWALAQAERRLLRDAAIRGGGKNDGFWRPVSVRWDKARGNAPGAVSDMKQRFEVGQWLSYEMTVDVVGEVQSNIRGTAAAMAGALDDLSNKIPAPAPAPASPALEQALSSQPQLARSIPFTALHTRVLAGVAEGAVEVWQDATSGLQVFNYKQPGAPKDPIWACCRGLVLHPGSETVVATPLQRFTELGERDAAVVGGDDAGGALSGQVSSGLEMLQEEEVLQEHPDFVKERALGPCGRCGCTTMHDMHGDRICFCDTCWSTGCDYSGSPVPQWSEVAGTSARMKHGAGYESDSASSSDCGLPLDDEDDVSGDEVQAANLVIKGSRKPMDRRWLPGGRYDRASAVLYSSAAWSDAADSASATYKVDGSLVIAFVWEGQVRVATRRRMDSEQVC